MGDPAQGWANCILYCLLTKKIRSRLLPCCRENQDEDKTADKNDDRPSRAGSKTMETDKEEVQQQHRTSELHEVACDITPLLADKEAQESPRYVTGPVCGTTPPKH